VKKTQELRGGKIGLEGEEGGAFFSKEVIEARREGESKTP
jgi:hypothetical protein